MCEKCLVSDEYVTENDNYVTVCDIIYDHIGKAVTSADVRNMIQAMNREVKEENTDARIQHVLHDFTEDSTGNVAKVVVDEADVATCIVFQTHGMRRFFALFPEVLMIDSTHHTNDRRYKLFGFMLHDAFGKGQFAQFALLDQETSVNMRHAVEAFKEHNPEWPSIEVIVLRKAYIVAQDLHSLVST